VLTKDGRSAGYRGEKKRDTETRIEGRATGDELEPFWLRRREGTTGITSRMSEIEY